VSPVSIENSLTHAHGNTLNEHHGNDPAPDHTWLSGVAHAIVERGSERGQETQNGKRDTKSRPQRELALEFGPGRTALVRVLMLLWHLSLLVSKGGQCLLIGRQFSVEDRYLIRTEY
jgi:hypothetical protein